MISRLPMFAQMLLGSIYIFYSVFAAESVLANEKKPNVIVILVDDMGFSDLGCYGSEIQTPNLDQLAANGASFTQFYNTARCWPTRASLMTGFYAQVVNRDQFEKARGGNSGVRPSWAPMLPELLKKAGYVSFHSGKWHLDGEPNACGFTHSYQLLDDNRHFAPNRHRLNGVDLPKVGVHDNYYASHAITDRMLGFLNDHHQSQPEQPFFAYVAYIAPHFPLHAPQPLIDKYQSVYQAGWDVVRQSRLRKQQALGFKTSSQAAAYEPQIGPPYEFADAIRRLGPGEVNREVQWDVLTDQQQSFQAAKMAIHAAMVDDIDQQVGRLVHWLEQSQQIKNTLLLFLSDNGASAEIMIRGDGHDPDAAPGSPASYLCLGPGWSRCANTPFRRHKTWVHEGGTATPLIAHWPAGIKSNGLREQVGHVACIAPTILELAGLPPVPRQEPGSPAEFNGISLARAITHNDALNTQPTVWWLHEGNQALRHEDWKIVRAANEPWQLYDMKNDRIESHDLAKEQPQQLQAMIAQWKALTATYASWSAQGSGSQP